MCCNIEGVVQTSVVLMRLDCMPKNFPGTGANKDTCMSKQYPIQMVSYPPRLSTNLGKL